MNAQTEKINGGHVLVILVAFFGVIIAVNLTLAALAVRSWTGLVVENGYVASQSFNHDLAEARRQAGLGWEQRVSFVGDRFTVVLNDQRMRPITGATVVVKLQRPSTDREDRELVLIEMSPGKYEQTASFSPGLWDAETTVRGPAGETLRHIYRLQVSGGSEK